MEHRPAEYSQVMLLVDRFIGEHFLDDPGIQFRARVMVSSWLLFLVTLAFFSVLIAFLPMKLEARISGFVLSGSISLLLLLLLYFFRRQGNYHLFARLSIFIGFMGIAISVFLSESPISSPSIGLFYIVPLLAVFFLGKQSGYVWMLLTLLLLIAFFIMDWFGFPFIALYDQSFLLETKLSAMMLGMTGVVGMVYAFEFANRKLREQRDMEYQRLAFLADHDELTGMANRNRFEKDVEQVVLRLGIENRQERLALLYLDLDGFKPINDSFGHEAGDAVLKVIAERVRALLKDRGHAARHGGDEFIILLAGIEGSGQVETFVCDLKNAIQQDIVFREHILHVDASIGIAMFPRDAQDIASLIRHADMAMYHAKQHHLPFTFYQHLG